MLAPDGVDNGGVFKLINEKDMEFLYACRHTAMPALRGPNTDLFRPDLVRRMVSTQKESSDGQRYFDATDKWIFEKKGEYYMIRNARDGEYLYSTRHAAQSSYNEAGVSVPSVLGRMVSTSPDVDDAGYVKIPKGEFISPADQWVPAEQQRSVDTGDSAVSVSDLRGPAFVDGCALWALEPVAGKPDKVRLINVGDGEGLYACRHMAMSAAKSNGQMDTSMHRRMVSTEPETQRRSLPDTDVWRLERVAPSKEEAAEEDLPRLLFDEEQGLLPAVGELLEAFGKAFSPKDLRIDPMPALEFSQMLGSTLLSSDYSLVDTDTVLKGKYVGLYFSASWCPPCRMFTPTLKDTYKKIAASRSDFEIVFLSRDSDQQAFGDYFAKMPWLAVPFSGSVDIDQLAEMFFVEGIPTLVLIGPDGTIINTDATGMVRSDPDGEAFPWKANAATALDLKPPSPAQSERPRDIPGAFQRTDWTPGMEQIRIPLDRCFDVQWNPPGAPTLHCSGLDTPFLDKVPLSKGGHYSFVTNGEHLSLLRVVPGLSKPVTVFSSVEWVSVGEDVLMFVGDGWYGTVIKGFDIPAGNLPVKSRTQAADTAMAAEWLKRNMQ